MRLKLMYACQLSGAIMIPWGISDGVLKSLRSGHIIGDKQNRDRIRDTNTHQLSVSANTVAALCTSDAAMNTPCCEFVAHAEFHPTNKMTCLGTRVSRTLRHAGCTPVS